MKTGLVLLCLVAFPVTANVAKAAEIGVDPGENVPFAAKDRVIYAPAPGYRLAPRAMRTEGRDLYLLYLRPNGTVRDVGIVRSTGSKDLDMSAMVTLVKWRFQPGAYTRMGVPVQFTIRRSRLPLFQ